MYELLHMLAASDEALDLVQILVSSNCTNIVSGDLLFWLSLIFFIGMLTLFSTLIKFIATACRAE